MPIHDLLGHLIALRPRAGIADNLNTSLAEPGAPGSSFLIVKKTRPRKSQWRMHPGRSNPPSGWPPSGRSTAFYRKDDNDGACGRPRPRSLKPRNHWSCPTHKSHALKVTHANRKGGDLFIAAFLSRSIFTLYGFESNSQLLQMSLRFPSPPVR